MKLDTCQTFKLLPLHSSGYVRLFAGSYLVSRSTLFIVFPKTINQSLQRHPDGHFWCLCLCLGLGIQEASLNC